MHWFWGENKKPIANCGIKPLKEICNRPEIYNTTLPSYRKASKNIPILFNQGIKNKVILLFVNQFTLLIDIYHRLI